MVEMLGLKNPLPTISSARARKKARSLSAAIIRWPGGHQQATQNDGSPGAQQPVGQHAAKKAGHVDQRRVGPIDGIGIPVAVPRKPLSM